MLIKDGAPGGEKFDIKADARSVPRVSLKSVKTYKASAFTSPSQMLLIRPHMKK